MDQSQYRYSAMSNLVLQADRRGRPGNEPTGEPESMSGRAEIKKMGDKVRPLKPTDSERQAAAKASKPRERKKIIGKTILDKTHSIEGLSYFPRTTETREVFEHILTIVYHELDDQSDDVVRSAADVAIEILLNGNLKDIQKKSEIDTLLGSKLAEDLFSNLLNLSKKITDYFPEESIQDDQVDSVAVIVDEMDTNAINDLEDTSSESEKEQFDNGETVINPLENKSKSVLSCQSIDVFWLQRTLSEHFTDALIRKSKSDQIMSLLEKAATSTENYSAVHLENNLMELFDFDRFDLVKLLVENHQKIFWVTRFLQCQNEEEKQKVQDEMVDLNQDHILRELYKGEVSKNLDELGNESKQQISTFEEDVTTKYPLPNKLLDLDSLKFDNGSHIMSNKQCVLPTGTKKIDHNTYLEIDIPLPENPTNLSHEKLVMISSLPEWAQAAFAGTTSLNRMQSKVYEAAFKSSENILLCAPTGAGKTNIAMLCILHEISKLQNNRNDKIYLEKLKVVYIAPLKALVQEVVGTFSERLSYLNLQISELTGDRFLTKDQIAKTNIIVTTPEKWDIITRKSSDTSYINLVTLVIIDEVHLLHDERGPVIESIVARSISSNEKYLTRQRLVGLSATLPNYKDVAAFMRVDSQGLFFFDQSYRPCPLKQTFIGVSEKKAINRIKTTNEVCYEKLLQQVKHNQVLIFVHSRKETAKTAKFIRDKALDEETIQNILRADTATRMILQTEADQSSNPSLKELLPFGIAIHHAGMNRADRQVAEDLFAEGLIRVLVSTATLAWGVNLPAHTVIIKGTQVYSPENGCWVELSLQDVLQMLGRAGRPQYDTYGEGIIITTHRELQYYLSLMNQQLPIESHLMAKLADNLNAEIVLGNVSTRDDAVDWLSKCYLYIRMLRAPATYGIVVEEDDEKLLQTLANLIHSAATKLANSGLIIYEKKLGLLQSTDLGKIGSYYYVTHNSLANYAKELTKKSSLIELFRLFSKSDEFKYIPVREEEKVELAKLLDRVPIPVRESVEDAAAKINVLLQTYISGQKLEGFALVADMVYISQSAGRLVRAIFEIAMKKKWSMPMKQALELGKMINNHMWSTMSPVRQFPNIDGRIIKSLERKNFPFVHYFDLNYNEIQELIAEVENSKFFYGLLRKFPRLEISSFVQPLTFSMIRVELNISPNFEWDDSYYGNRQQFWIFVEDSEGETLLYSESFWLRKQYFGEPYIVQFTVSIPQIRPANLLVSIVSDKFLGSETRQVIFFGDVLFPEKFLAHTQLLDLQQLPVSALSSSKYYSEFSPNFEKFNQIQSQCFNTIYKSNNNFILTSPKGTGKAVCAELTLLRFWESNSQGRVVYLNPSEQKLEYKLKYLKSKYSKVIQKFIGDLSDDLKILANSDVILATPRQWNTVSRRWKQRKTVQAIRLVICDEIQFISGVDGAIYEEVISRLKYMAAQLQLNIRIVALGVSIANVRDLSDWLDCANQNCYNFSPKIQNLTKIIKAFDGDHAPSLILAMLKPLYMYVVQKARYENTIVFCNSDNQCKETTYQFIALDKSSGNEFLQMDTGKSSSIIDKIKNTILKEVLYQGVGFLYEGLDPQDYELVIELWRSKKLHILFASKEVAYHLPIKAYLTIVMGTLYYDAKDHKYYNYTVNQILFMFSKTNMLQKKPIAILMTASNMKDYFEKFLHDSLPIESNLYLDLHDVFNAEIASKSIISKQDAVDWVTWTFLYRRLLSNPGYYELADASTDALSNYLSELVEVTIQDLVDAQMIIEDQDTGNCSALNASIIAAYYQISYITIQTLMLNLNDNIKMKRLMETISTATEFDVLTISKYEDITLSKICNALAIQFSNLQLTSSSGKALVLLAAYFSRLEIPDHLEVDQKYVVRTAMQLLSACVDILSSTAKYKPCLKPIELSQMLVQAVWNWDSVLLQIPHFDKDTISKAEGMEIKDVYDFQDLEEEQKNQLLSKFTKKQLVDIAAFVNNYPSLEIQVANIKRQEKSVLLTLNLDKGFEDDEQVLECVVAPYYPIKKSENWWIFVYVEDLLLATRKVNFSKTLSVNMEFETEQKSIRISCLCDSFIGADTEVVL